MASSTWLGSDSSNKYNLFLKIVHSGGLVELYDGPVPALEIMDRNPRCVVAKPSIFQEPWSVVPPDTLLMPGQKFYVVPISTVRKLQRRSISGRHKNASQPFGGKQPTSGKGHKVSMDSDTIILMKIHDSRSDQVGKRGRGYEGFDEDDEEELCCDSCFTWLFSGKDDHQNGDHLGDHRSKQMRTRSVSFGSSSSETARLNKTKGNNNANPSQKLRRSTSGNSWQPSLESITEE